MLVINHPTRPVLPTAAQRGFTLGELIVVLVVVSSLSVGYMTWKQNVLADLIVQKTADGIILIQEALYGYRMDAAHGYVWPAVISDLDPYLPNFTGGGRNGVGQPYRIDPPPPLVRPTDGLIVETEMLTAAQAQLVARRFPLTGAAVGKTVRVGVPVPGHEEAREAVLARDGARDMLGDLDMGGNNIADTNLMQSTRVTVTGDEIILDGQTLHKNDIQLLQEIAALDCRDGAVRVAGRTASCVESVTRCRMCATAIPFPVSTSQGACSTPSSPGRELCTGWTDAPAWTNRIYDARNTAGCFYNFYMQCDGQPTGSPGRHVRPLRYSGTWSQGYGPSGVTGLRPMYVPPQHYCDWPGGWQPIDEPCRENPH